MTSNIPTPAQVKKALNTLGHAQMQELSALSGVAFNTLWNVRSGATENPGLKAVQKFFPLIEQVRKQAA